MTIDELFSISKGKKPPDLFDEASATTIPFLKIDAIRQAGQHQYCEPSRSLVICEKDDVLIVWDGAYSGLASFGLEGAIGSTIARLRPRSDKVFGPYAGRFLQSKFHEIQSNATGAAIPHVNGGHLRRLEIPLPPLDEQKRISAVLDKADALRRQRRESLELTDKLLQSVFIDMFVRASDVKHWPQRSVASLAKDEKGSIRTGPFGSQLLHSEFVDEGIAVLGIDNAVENRFVWKRERFITPEKFKTLKRYKVFPGDLIITIMGTVGRCAVVPNNIPDAINTKHLCCITLDQEKCLPEFLHAAFLHHPELSRQLTGRTKGAVMPGLNMGIIKDLALALPPIDLQTEYARLARSYEVLRGDLRNSDAMLQALFSSLQQRAFSGELDLSRINASGQELSTINAATHSPIENRSRYKRPGGFATPPEVELRLQALEESLDTGAIGDSIAWDEDYFKYRTLNQVVNAPFSFGEIWEAVQYDMEDANYEVVKAKIFEYVAEGTLTQSFDETRKEVVFYPRA
jgi:type I restriction enzyme, S subunit